MSDNRMREYINMAVGILAMTLSVVALIQSSNQASTSVYGPIYEKQIEIVEKSSALLKEIEFQSTNYYGYICVALYLKENNQLIFSKLTEAFDKRGIRIEHENYDELSNEYNLWMPSKLDASYMNAINVAYLFSNQSSLWKTENIDKNKLDMVREQLIKYRKYHHVFIQDVKSYFNISRSTELFESHSNAYGEQREYLESGLDEYLLNFAKRYNLPEACFSVPTN